MFFIFTFILILFSFNYSQTIKQLNEISVKEELPIGSFVTSLTDKIPNLDQSIEYDLVTPLSSDFDLFSIDHTHHSLVIKNRVDYEYICLKRSHCTISVSIAVSNEDTIDVYIFPIRIININDNPIKFLVNRTVIEIEENDENWSNKTYALPQAYDDDGDPISYSIYLQNWSKPDGLFEFDEKNLLLKPLKKFNREEQNIYLLRFIAHNQNDASTDIIILIKDLNDNSPICHPNQTLFLISNISKISIFSLNVTDLDEGDNGKLEYQLINPLSGFTIDRYNGQIKFDYRQWIRSNETILIVNVTDHGKPVRLSTKCLIEIKFTFLIEIDFYSNNSMINQSEIFLDIQNLNLPIGQFRIYDKQENQSCFDCVINMNTSLKDIFFLDYTTFDLYFNLNSMILMKILTNYFHRKENLSLNIQIDIINLKNPSIKSTKNYSLILHLNKINLLISSNIFFLKINENSFLNEHISIFNHYHPCLNDETKYLMIIDPTNTFEIDQKLNLILKKYLNTKQQNIYHITLQQKSNNSTNEVSDTSSVFCSIQLHIYIVNPYSIDNVYPYFSEAFYILSSKNISQFYLPPIPFYVKYKSSEPDMISVNPFNGSIIIRSSSLYSSYYYDFLIEAMDSRIPSLSSSVSIRIFFGVNKHSPRLLINSTRQTMEILSSKYLYQIKAYDPDILLNDQTNLLPPTIEYEIDSSIDNIEIERFTGRIFLKYLNTTKVNFTLIMTDFGQPNRLITRHTLTFDIKSKENLSISFLIISSLIVLIILLLSILLLIINCCCTTHRKSHEKPTWKNVSPTAPDTRLIDNEYVG
jgi:hypothetical protein